MIILDFTGHFFLDIIHFKYVEAVQELLAGSHFEYYYS